MFPTVPDKRGAHIVRDDLLLRLSLPLLLARDDKSRQANDLNLVIKLARAF